jgi:hypothetical protein
MKYKRTTLLAGVAVLVLVAGSGFTLAQDGSKNESGQGATPHATQQMNRGGTSGQSRSAFPWFESYQATSASL